MKLTFSVYNVQCVVNVGLFGIHSRSKEEGDDEAKRMCAHTPSCDKTVHTVHYIIQYTLLTVYIINSM